MGTHSSVLCSFLLPPEGSSRPDSPQIYWQAKALRSPAADSLTLGFPNGSPLSFGSIGFAWRVLREMLLQEFSRGEKTWLLFDFGRETDVPSKSHFSQNFPSLWTTTRVAVSGRHVHGTHPSLCPPGVNVTMPAQPGMPPVSSTQLQIDTTLQEFQLVDLSRRFLVHDSFWALPEQFLGNKVTGPPWVGRGPVPRIHARSLPVLRSL